MLRAGISALSAILAAGAALAADPPAPAGQDPGGTAVALISIGVDYTLPEIARSAARDGEGEIIGFDLVDVDHRPYAAAGDAGSGRTDQAIARALSGGGLRLVHVRTPVEDGAKLARAIGFVAQTPARVAVISSTVIPHINGRPDWSVLRQALKQFADVKFVIFDADPLNISPMAMNITSVRPQQCASASASPIEQVLVPLCNLQSQSAP